MIFLMDENTMTVGEILEFIKEKDIDKGNKVLYDAGVEKQFKKTYLILCKSLKNAYFFNKKFGYASNSFFYRFIHSILKI